ncbi:MAG TPA: DUF2059 domain-containing protein, partial [Acetobacteraceae bacterium]|nr:DUF2059 domain-containing protein [Acetobacteraceae bacterium]
RRIRAMADHLSIPDMKQIEAFERTPVGERLRGARAAMTREMYDYQQDWRTKIWPAVYAMHKHELDALGITKKEKAP